MELHSRNTKNRPLITIALISHDHEKFIERAIQGVLSQNYFPLEIILSNDCSNDNTYGLLEKAASTYSGPHSIRLNRTSRNLNVSGHMNEIFKLAKGEIIVSASGDDISKPDRVETIFKAWNHFDRKPNCIYSDFEVIDELGSRLPNSPYSKSCGSKKPEFIEENYSLIDFLGPNKPVVFGCCAAWSRNLIRQFGPLDEDNLHEDEALALRACCLGSIVKINAPLLQYRVHENNQWARNDSKPETLREIDDNKDNKWKEISRRCGMYTAFLHDISVAREKQIIDHSTYRSAKFICDEKQNSFNSLLRLRDSKIAKKPQAVWQALKSNRKFTLLSLIPWFMLRRIKLFRNRFLNI